MCGGWWYFYYTICGEKIYINEARKPSKINGFRHLTNVYYFHDKENLFSWLLTFGDKVELLEPEGLREEIRLLAENIGKKYKKN